MYEYIRKLGQGSFGEVWKVKKGDQIIALKKIVLKNEKMIKLALAEVKMLKELSQKCIPALVCFYDYHLDGTILYIEMEYIDGLTLRKFAEKHRKDPKFLKSLIGIIKDIIPSIHFLHEHGVIHRDIKPDNIMIDNKLQPKLIDIGLGCLTYKIEDGERIPQTCNVSGEQKSCCLGYAGTPLFVAPEILLHSVAYSVSDIFSFGASIYNAATGKSIYSMSTKFYIEPKTFEELKALAAEGDYTLYRTDNPILDALIKKMVVYTPISRITCQQIMSFFND